MTYDLRGILEYEGSVLHLRFSDVLPSVLSATSYYITFLHHIPTEGLVSILLLNRFILLYPLIHLLFFTLPY